MNKDDIEKEVTALGLNAPRITPEDVSAVIGAWEFHVFPHSQMTVCCITLLNGFTVTGESACVSPENFNKELGEKYSHLRAKDKVFELLAFQMCQRRFEAEGELEGNPFVVREESRRTNPEYLKR